MQLASALVRLAGLIFLCSAAFLIALPLGLAAVGLACMAAVYLPDAS